MENTIFLNGKFLSAEEAKISVLTPGFLLGWGLFETMRSYKNKIIYLNEHIKRILDSCSPLDIKPRYPAAKIKAVITEGVKMSGFKDAYVRLTLAKSEKGTDTVVIIKKYNAPVQSKYREGFRASICGFRQNENSYFSQIKTTCRLLYELEFNEAKKKGFDEGLILNSNGFIVEGTRSNIFLVKDKTLLTPHLSCGCLKGVTRGAILDLAAKYKINTYKGNFTIQDIYNCDEAFLTNSLMGVMPLSGVEKEKIGKGKPGHTKFFIDKYNAMLQ